MEIFEYNASVYSFSSEEDFTLEIRVEGCNHVLKKSLI